MQGHTPVLGQIFAFHLSLALQVSGVKLKTLYDKLKLHKNALGIL